MNAAADTRGTPGRHLPLLLGLLAALRAGTALQKMFWTAFGMYRALRASGIRLHG